MNERTNDEAIIIFFKIIIFFLNMDKIQNYIFMKNYKKKLEFLLDTKNEKDFLLRMFTKTRLIMRISMFLQETEVVSNIKDGSELDIKNLKVTELRAELAARNLSTKGEIIFYSKKFHLNFLNLILIRFKK